MVVNLGRRAFVLKTPGHDGKGSDIVGGEGGEPFCLVENGKRGVWGGMPFSKSIALKAHRVRNFACGANIGGEESSDLKFQRAKEGDSEKRTRKRNKLPPKALISRGETGSRGGPFGKRRGSQGKNDKRRKRENEIRSRKWERWVLSQRSRPTFSRTLPLVSSKPSKSMS